MFSGELFAPTRCTRLIQHGRALRRRFTEVNAGHLEVFSDVADFMDFARVAENPTLTIPQDRALLPTAFPELVANLQVLYGEIVAGVVLGGFHGPLRGAPKTVGINTQSVCRSHA